MGWRNGGEEQITHKTNGMFKCNQVLNAPKMGRNMGQYQPRPHVVLQSVHAPYLQMYTGSVTSFPVVGVFLTVYSYFIPGLVSWYSNWTNKYRVHPWSTMIFIQKPVILD